MTESNNLTISVRSVLNNTIKLVLMAAFYIAGALSANQVSVLTIDTQRSRISELESETETQRLEINDLTQRVTKNADNLAAIAEIRDELTAIRTEIKVLKEFHER